MPDSPVGVEILVIDTSKKASTRLLAFRSRQLPVDINLEVIEHDDEDGDDEDDDVEDDEEDNDECENKDDEPVVEFCLAPVFATVLFSAKHSTLFGPDEMV